MPTLPRLLLAALFMALWPCAGACQTPTSQRAEAGIRSDLKSILGSPEFRPAQGGESVLTRAADWLHDRWSSFWTWLRKKFSFNVGGELVSTPGLQWVFIAAFAVLAAWVLARLLPGALAARGARVRRRKPPAAQAEESEPDIGLPEDRLSEAQRMAEAGDYRQALRLVLLAALARLQAVGTIRVERSRTNGEYLRALERGNRVRLAGSFRPLTDLFDRAWYGGIPASRADFEASRLSYSQLNQAIGATTETSVDRSQHEGDE